MLELDRRQFLKTFGAGALVAGTGLPGLRLALGGSGADDTLIVVFLRGGCDGLHLVPPTGGADRIEYEIARPDLQLPVSGVGSALPLANSGAGWGLHPSAGALQALYQSGHLAVVLGCGMPEPVTRSHFDAQTTMELGTPGQQGIGSGWLSRHLASMGMPASVPIPAVCADSMTGTSLLGSSETITMADGEDFRIETSAWGWNSRDHYPDGPPAGFQGLVETLPQLWNDSSALDQAGRQTLDALQLIRPMDFHNYAPTNGAVYPGRWGDQLKMLAQLIKSGVGLRVATVDLASWDTHNGQSYQFENMVESLSAGLDAFYTDLAGAGAANYMGKVSVVVMSEFGRRVRENSSGGTDHGYGNVMLAMGGAVNGGQVYGLGSFAGLASEQRYHGEDVDVSVDYRRILSEAIIRRQGNNHLGHVFPGYTGYSPMGVFQGIDLPPDYSDDWDVLFKNGFD